MGGRPRFRESGDGLCSAHCPALLKVTMGPAREGQQRPLLFQRGGRGLRPPKGPFLVSLDRGWQQEQPLCHDRGSLGRAAGASGQQLPCHLPPPAQPQAPASACGQGAGQGGARPTGDRCVGGLGGQVALSGPGGCLEGVRQTDGVTPQSPRAWLGATGSLDPPSGGPPHRHPD